LISEEENTNQIYMAMIVYLLTPLIKLELKLKQSFYKIIYISLRSI